MKMVNICNDYYRVVLGGKRVTVNHQYSRVTSRLLYLDGTEITDKNTFDEIFPQLTISNKISLGSLSNALRKKVEWSDYPSVNLPKRKVIELKNGDMLAGYGIGDEILYNLAMVNRFGDTDYGSQENHTNISSIDRPTVQLAGQDGGADDNRERMAFLSDIESAIGDIGKLLDSINGEVI